MKQGDVHICFIRDNGPQCGYVTYAEGPYAWRKKVPTHVHKDASGGFVSRNWGPESECTYVPVEARP